MKPSTPAVPRRLRDRAPPQAQAPVDLRRRRVRHRQSYVNLRAGNYSSRRPDACVDLPGRQQYPVRPERLRLQPLDDPSANSN